MKELFAYFSQFQKISKEVENEIEAISSMIHVAKNNILQPFNHTCKTIYFLKQGIVRIYYLKDGIDITEGFYFENSMIARVESLFTGKPTKKAIQVLQDAEIISINAKKLFNLYDKYPLVERLFRKIFEAGYVETIHRMESIQFHSAEQRYKDLLLKTDIVKRIPLKFIASYLGITQVSLSRIRAGLNE
jgi:CRP-like cAMP-binding protein